MLPITITFTLRKKIGKFLPLVSTLILSIHVLNWLPDSNRSILLNTTRATNRVQDPEL